MFMRVAKKLNSYNICSIYKIRTFVLIIKSFLEFLFIRIDTHPKVRTRVLIIKLYLNKTFVKVKPVYLKENNFKVNHRLQSRPKSSAGFSLRLKNFL